MSTADVPQDETPGQRAARLRREKRQAKAAGEDRLAKIKQLNGGIAPPTEVLGGPAPRSAEAGDPDEVDITTQNYGGPQADGFNGASADNPMLQAMMQMQREQGRRQQAGPGPSQADGQEDDPIAKMMQQMMGMAGGDPNDPNNIHNAQDPLQMLSTLLNGGKSPPSAASQASKRSTYLWRLTHAIFAMTIAGYIAATSTFDGSWLARTTQSTYVVGNGNGLGSRLFLIFITAELGLQSTRLFLEGSQLQGGGILATISNIAPEPYASYVRIAGRWLSILGSIVSDAMVVVFVLGVMAWWKGAATVS